MLMLKPVNANKYMPLLNQEQKTSKSLTDIVTSVLQQLLDADQLHLSI